jgi:hypothetical protein
VSVDQKMTADITLFRKSRDRSTNALNTIDYAHHEVHAGSHYLIEDVVDLATNNVYDMQFTTPDTAKWTHFTFELNCESETEWMIYEGATILLAGTAITPINNNRNSDKTSGNTIAGISNTTLVNANLDTAVAGATMLAHGIVGAKQNGGIISRENEIVLKQNTVYCMRAIANTAGYVNFICNWYEHTNIPT